jgi:hypothetical protein
MGERLAFGRQEALGGRPPLDHLAGRARDPDADAAEAGAVGLGPSRCRRASTAARWAHARWCRAAAQSHARPVPAPRRSRSVTRWKPSGSLWLGTQYTAGATCSTCAASAPPFSSTVARAVAPAARPRAPTVALLHTDA